MMKELFTGLTAVNISPENALAIVEAFDKRFQDFERTIEGRFKEIAIQRN